MSGSSQVIQRLKEKYGDAVEDLTLFSEDPLVEIPRQRAYEIVEFLKTDPDLAFTMFVDLCGVDYPEREDRFDVVYNLRSFKAGHHIRIKARLPASEPSVPSVTPLFAAANWFEREAYDMFGIVFTGHPNLKRLLTHDEFQGHPLRKDYVSTERHVCTRTTDLD